KILPDLKKLYPKLSKIYLRESDFAKFELLPFLRNGFQIGKPYNFYITKDRLTLVNADKNIPEERFSFKAYDDRLNLPGTRSLEWKFFNANVLPIIKDFKPYFKNDMVEKNELINQEIIPSLVLGYSIDDPYKIIQTQKGFRLENSKDFQDFNLDDYDDKLVLPDTQKKETSTPLSSQPEEELTDFEINEQIYKEKDRIKKEKFDDEARPLENEETIMDIDFISNQMNSLAEKTPELKAINDELVTLFNEINSQMAKGHPHLEAKLIAVRDLENKGSDPITSFKRYFELAKKVRYGQNIEAQVAFDLHSDYFMKMVEKVKLMKD
ncbi:MAG: hypothetical protein AAB373_05015, partial [Patescibacteria group bacterium]